MALEQLWPSAGYLPSWDLEESEAETPNFLCTWVQRDFVVTQSSVIKSVQFVDRESYSGSFSRWNEIPLLYCFAKTTRRGDDRTKEEAIRLAVAAVTEEGSERLLSLGDDWDGEGSSAYSPHTIELASSFLSTFARQVWRLFRLDISMPRLLPGPDGAIDMRWKAPKFELLLELPPNDTFAVYYGDNSRGEATEGTLDLQSSRIHHGLVLWLTQ